MKRRGFFGLLGKVAGALTVSPLVARDMGDFEYRDTTSFPAVPAVSEGNTEPRIPVEPVEPIDYRPRPPIEGQIQYNTTTRSLEVYANKKWITVVV